MPHAMGAYRSGPFFVALSLGVLLVGCAEPVRPVQQGQAPAGPRGEMTYYESYPPTYVLTSTGDTCASYVVASEIQDPFWSGTDEARLANPDSVAAADSMTTGDSTYTAPLALIDASTGGELYAGPCEVLYNRCTARCPRLPTRKQRALCWAGCMNRYAQCLADELVDKYFPPPTQCKPQGSFLIYDPDDTSYDQDCGGTTGAGGGGSTGSTSGSSCHTEWVAIEIGTGTSWTTYWEGFATVCE